MKKLKNNSGASMVEVMIYMVIGLIVIGYALSSMDVISTGYVRGRTVMKMQKDGRDAVQLLARDIANLGFKFYVDEIDANVWKDFNSDNTITNEDITFYMTRPSPTVQSFPNDYRTDPIGTVDLSDDANWFYATYYGFLNVGSSSADSAASFNHTNANATAYDELLFYKMKMSDSQTEPDIVSVHYRVDGDGTLWRDDIIANQNGLANAARADRGTWYGSVWGAGTTNSVAILENVAALQYLFSKDGASWTNSTTNERHLYKMIKIQLLVQSHRDVNGAVSPSYTFDEGTSSEVTIPAGSGLLRLYEKIVEIPNNGIIALSN